MAMGRLLVMSLLLVLACDPAGSRPEAPLPRPSTPPPPSTAPPMSAAVSAAASAKPPAVAAGLATGGRRAVKGERGMVSSEDPHATRIGAAVLAAGGNAVDAAVAVAYALSVTHHAAGSLGGGGFMIVRLASGAQAAIDYRETAPAAATVELNEKQLAHGAHGYLSAPVPGVVAGLELARERFGSKPRAELVAPAIELAKKGHAYGERQALVLSWLWQRMSDPELRRILGRGAQPIGRGQRLKQPALAASLELVAREGKAGFYQGELAKKIAAAHKRGGGLVTEADLAGYQAKIREPLSIRYRGYTVLTMPPPSMGGIAVATTLLGLESFEKNPAAAGSPASLHAFVEAARRAYADRRAVGADPDVVGGQIAPLLARLLDPRYHAARKPAFDPARATPSAKIVPIATEAAPAQPGTDTTHFSVVDRHGNAVSCTTTLSAAFGARVAVPGTGIVLSNAMGGFSPSGVNTLAPHKRMASSMSPVILLSGERVAAALGSPGGDTIPSTVSQVVRHLVDHRMSIDEAVAAGRVHHQHEPDELRFEKLRAPSKKAQDALAAMGHRLRAHAVPLGDVNGIVVDPKSGVSWGFADDRKGGLALGP